jgi:hypothetical protein
VSNRGAASTGEVEDNCDGGGSSRAVHDRGQGEDTATAASTRSRRRHQSNRAATRRPSSEKTGKKIDPHEQEKEDLVAQVQRQERRLGEERKPNPNFGSVYHVMNSTCIHLRVEDIYMYRRRRIYKEPPRVIQ